MKYECVFTAREINFRDREPLFMAADRLNVHADRVKKYTVERIGDSYRVTLEIEGEIPCIGGPLDGQIVPNDGTAFSVIDDVNSSKYHRYFRTFFGEHAFYRYTEFTVDDVYRALLRVYSHERS